MFPPHFFLSRFTPRSLRVRLAMTFTLLVAFLLLAADAGLIGYAHYAASHRANQALERGLEIVQSALANEVSEVGKPVGGNKMAFLAAAPPAAEVLGEMEPALAQEGLAALIIDGKGNIWRGLRSESLPAFSTPSTESVGWRIRSRRIPASNDTEFGGPYTIVVGTWWQQTETSLLEQAALLSGLTFFMVLVAGFGAYVLVGHTLRPIAHLAQQARERAAQNTVITGSELHLTPSSPDVEVVHLVTTLNALLDSLAETTAMKNRFYIAASHELRSPLQVLSGRAELTLSLPRSREEYQEALVEMQEQTTHLITLVQSLLLLNRLERTPASPPHYEACPIVTLCQEQIKMLEPQKGVPSLRLVFDSVEEPPVVRSVSTAHGEILLRNLLENAVRYTPTEGTICVVLRLLSSHTLELEIVNTAIPMRAADATRLTEPFYRPDPSRSSQTGGSGLGLSICRTLADVNGWNLSLWQDDAGFHAAIIFPLFSATQDTAEQALP